MSHKLSHHKLRIVVHVDVDRGNISVDVGGCLTQNNFPALLHLLLRAQRLASAPQIALDLRHAIHLDAGVLAHLRHIASPGSHRSGQHAAIHHAMGLAAAAALEEAEDFRLSLLEPVYLPVCPIHSAADFEAARRDAVDAAVVGHPNQPTDPVHPVRPSRAASVKRSTHERAAKALRVHH
ncbi:hypothetical protein [Arthrobacter sp. S39]|uniref:hypothetical protein n=1 Tax=Arthrobacter sp. S39 TaxID=2509720 RepID=UPI0013EF8E27|nr:hypothetical protein [Arthrobacter sp. S39]